ncbi:acyltransferase family protein [Streptomyces sp. MC1]|uniref:acyltransferase family protein n=1 Tax=Streptomyces TaxID=1883 RepID=UPI0006C05EAC|nr:MULTISPECIES: acyltransferase family protein [unclassified Streptomyces]KOV93183.1 membrane protein [Streptomyces sp. NRRL WC-3723]MBG7697492.1 acyltransferase family protein [Streptomyces sp. MC1]
MFDAATSPGHSRRPLPPAQSPVRGEPDRRTPTHAQEQSRTDRPGRQRDAFFDNAKYLAIVLVALGHSWSAIKTDNRALESLYNVVYTFHMPAFIVISGYFSRSFDMRPDRLKRLVTGIAVPYLLFQIAYSLFRRYAGQADDPISLVSPYYLTWFLCALFIWRLTTPLWKLVRRPLPLALGIAMVGSVTPGLDDNLDLGRVLQFLPCFVLGLLLKPEHFALIRRRAVRVLSVPVFAAALAVGWWSVPRVDGGWFYRQSSAPDIGAPWWTGPLMTLAMFGCALLLTACFLAWVPGRRTWFTALGAGTLYGYLLHGFVVKATLYTGGFDLAEQYGALGTAAVTVLAAAAVTVLCTKPVQRVFRFAMEPKMEWAFREDAAELARERHKQRETVGV